MIAYAGEQGSPADKLSSPIQGLDQLFTAYF